jgi:hypothetical protein
MERLCEYLTDGDVRTAQPLPDGERIAALAEFEGAAESESGPVAIPGREASLVAVPERHEQISPVRVFISYSREDREIALAVRESLARLGDMIHGAIRIVLDMDDVALGESFRDILANALREAEFFLVLNSGPSSSHSFTAFEVGFFNALIQDDLRRSSRTTRRVVSFNFAQSPTTVLDSFLNVDVSIAAEDLRKSREEYLQSFKQSPEKEDALFRVYYEIARTAKTRLPFSGKPDPDKFAIAQALMPLRAALFESLQTRVVSETIWNGFVNFDLSAAAANQPSIDPDTRLTMNQKAWTLFGVSTTTNGITWGELKTATGGETPLLSVMEQIVLDAILTSASVENERIVHLNHGPALRVVPARRTDHYDGRKTVQLYLMESTQRNTLGNRETSILLGIIATSARYKDLFDRKSRFSPQSFRLARGKERTQDLTRQLIRQLRLIEEETFEADIFSPEVLITIFGNDEAFLPELMVLTGNWYHARGEFTASASRILDSSLQPSEFESARVQLMSMLQSFQQFSERSSIVAVRALGILDKIFREGLPSQAPA